MYMYVTWVPIRVYVITYLLCFPTNNYYITRMWRCDLNLRLLRVQRFLVYVSTLVPTRGACQHQARNDVTIIL